MATGRATAADMAGPVVVRGHPQWPESPHNQKPQGPNTQNRRAFLTCGGGCSA